MNTKIKKSLLLLLTIFTFVLATINASVQFTVTEGKNLTLYNEQYEIVDSLTPIDKDGYIIQTGDENVVLSSDFAEVYIAPNTIFSITDFSTSNPTCYLISGQVNIFILYPQNVKINCYTPTSNFMISDVGEYILSSSDDEENFYNLSQSSTEVYDSIRAKTFSVAPYTYAALFTGESNIDITKAQYLDLAIFSTDKVEELYRAPEAVTNLSVKVERYIPKIPQAPSSLTVERKKLPEIPSFTKTYVAPFVEKLPQSPTLTVKVTQNIQVPTAPNFTKIIVNENPKKVSEIAPSAEVNIIPTEIVPSEPVETAPIEENANVKVITDRSKKNNPFSIHLTTSLTLDDEDGVIPVLAIQPNVDTGTFKANFNIDVLNLLSFMNLENSGKAYYQYATSFINLISYNTINEKFGISLSRLDSSLNYDPLGLFFPEDRNYELTRSKLTITHYFKSNYFNQSLILDDLALNSSFIKANYTAKVKFSKNSNTGLLFGTNAILPYENLRNTILMPFVTLSASLYSNDHFSIGAEVGGASLLNFVDKYDLNNSLISLALPIDFYGANITFGASYNFGSLAKGATVYDYTHYNPNSLDLTLSSSYKNDFVSFRFNLLLPVDINAVNLKLGQEFLDLALGFKKNNYKLELGFKSFGIFDNFIESMKNNGDFYTTLSYVDNNFETGLSVIRNKGVYNLKIFNTIKNFSYVNKEIVDKIDNRIFNFGIDVAYKAQVSDFGTISLLPFFSLGNEDYNLALQLPVAVKLDDTIFSFETYENNLYNFGNGATNEVEKIFDIINDSTTFIKKITLGNSTTPFHFYMNRDYAFDGTSNFVDFKKYSFKDHLTTILGTRFGQYGNLDLIVPNIAVPNLVASNITILPNGRPDVYDIEFNLPVEFLIQKDGKFSLSSFPFLKANLYFKNFGMNLYFTTMLNLNNNMSDKIVCNQYLFGNNERYTIGGGMNLSFFSSKILLNGGAYKYRNDSEYFNPFYEMIGYSAFYEASTQAFTNLKDNTFKYFAELEYQYETEQHKLKLSYRVDDILGYLNADYGADIFNFDYAYTASNGNSLALGCYLAGVKGLFTTLDFESYINSNKVLAYFNLNKTFNHYQIGIQLNVAPQVNKNATPYVNSFTTFNNAIVSFSTYATLRY